MWSAHTFAAKGRGVLIELFLLSLRSTTRAHNLTLHRTICQAAVSYVSIDETRISHREVRGVFERQFSWTIPPVSGSLIAPSKFWSASRKAPPHCSSWLKPLGSHGRPCTGWPPRLCT